MSSNLDREKLSGVRPAFQKQNALSAWPKGVELIWQQVYLSIHYYHEYGYRG